MFTAEPTRGEVTRFCAEHGISRAVFYKIRAVARVEGPEVAVVARSTAPVNPPHRVARAVEDQALRIRAALAREGLDAGPLSVASKMVMSGEPVPSRATLARVFTRRGVVTPEPSKRPRASYQRFTYPDPNACWQLDGTEYTLDTGVAWCVLQVEDDYSRMILASLVAVSENTNAAIEVVSRAVTRHGAPQFFLTDNGVALNLSRRGSESGLEAYLKRQGTTPITGRPNKPTTQGKNERLHRTLQKFLDAHRPIYTPTRLQMLVDQFEDYYNTSRAHQALSEPGRIPTITPAHAYHAAPKALPAPTPITTPTHVKTWINPGGQPLRHTPENATLLDATTGTWQADRIVQLNGIISICHARVFVGTPLKGTILHTLFNDHTITIIDPNGVILGTVPRPRPGTKARYSITPRTPGRPRTKTLSPDTELSTNL